MYRCMSDFWGYCSSPEFDVELVGDANYGGHCRLNPKTCGKYRTFLQDMRRQIDDAKDILIDWSRHDKFIELVAQIEKKEKEAEIEA